MKLIKRVSPIEAKRAFVISQYIRRHRRKLYMPLLSAEAFRSKLAEAKKYAKTLNDAQLDRIIGREYIPRRDAYNAVDWHIGTASTAEVAVWKGAGGLPILWTHGSLRSTAEKVSEAMRKNSKLLKKRVKRSIPRILRTSSDHIQKDRYLFPIILPAGTIRNCRRGLKKFKGDIDDGCMRSIALAVSGKKTIKAFIGTKKRRRS